MALTIKTTGLDQYAPGGHAVLKLMLVGGPGAGKTRMSSFWPKPIYANCEAGLASVADRKVPFVDIATSEDMLDLLVQLKRECARPSGERRFQTVVIDTVDAFQRKCKQEWLTSNPGASSFEGRDAWGFLDSKMQVLLTRLLGLDMNVIILAHYENKTIKEGVGNNATERVEVGLQLQGKVKDTIFNDLDLVGWMGTFWDVEDGQRVEKRGLSFKKTPERWFLKDRLHIMPSWMEVTFSDEDYANLFSALIGRLDDLDESQTIGTIESQAPEVQQPQGGIVHADSAGGALPPQEAKDLPLDKHDKPSLQKIARELGITYAGNTLKSELIIAIENKRAEGSDASAASPPPPGVVPPQAPPAPPTSAPTTLVAEAQTSAQPPATTTPGADREAGDPPMALDPSIASAPTTPVIDTTTGEMSGPMDAEDIARALDGQVISTELRVEAPPMASTPAPVTPPAAVQISNLIAPPGTPCSDCGKALDGENQDYVQLSMIKNRRYQCNEHYIASKQAARR